MPLFLFSSPDPIDENRQLYLANDVLGFDYLGDYGDWVQDPEFGLVWKPCCIPTWRPFYYGHWIFTQFGWTWVDYEPFGWIVCHYGSWIRKHHSEWLWIPGYEWEAAPVHWIQYDRWIGWSPLQGSISPPWTVHGNPDWVVVNVENFAREMIGFYCNTVYQHPTSKNAIRTTVPELDEVSRLSNQRIQMVDASLQSQNGSLKLVLPWSEIQKIQRFRHNLWNKLLKPRNQN
jgi:hypothetical protein